MVLDAVGIMDILFRFADPKALGVAVEKGLFTKLSDGRTVDVREAAMLLGIEERPARFLLIHCTALGALKCEGGRYRNSSGAEEFLVEGREGNLVGVVSMWNQRLYPAWEQLLEAVQTNHPQTWGESDHFGSIFEDPRRTRLFLEAMHGLSTQSGRALARAFDFSRYPRLLDVGGGSGAYSIELARHFPRLRATVFDLAPAIAVAQEKIAAAGPRIARRVSTLVGDFFKGLPSGFDAFLLSMILHDWTPEEDVRILRNVWNALASGGIVIVSELMMNDDGTGPLSAARMAGNMLVENRGFNYSWQDYERWLRKFGFRKIRRIPLESPAANGVIIGVKP